MTTKQITQLVSGNETITLLIANDWKLIKNTNSRLGNNIRVEHTTNLDKWEVFNTEAQAIKYFMTKYSSVKRFYKTKRMSVEPSISVL